MRARPPALTTPQCLQVRASTSSLTMTIRDPLSFPAINGTGLSCDFKRPRHLGSPSSAARSGSLQGLDDARAPTERAQQFQAKEEAQMRAGSNGVLAWDWEPECAVGLRLRHLPGRSAHGCNRRRTHWLTLISGQVPLSHLGVLDPAAGDSLSTSTRRGALEITVLSRITWAPDNSCTTYMARSLAQANTHLWSELFMAPPRFRGMEPPGSQAGSDRYRRFSLIADCWLQ